MMKSVGIVALVTALVCAGCAAFPGIRKTNPSESHDGLGHSAVDYCAELAQPLADLVENLYGSDVDEMRWNNMTRNEDLPARHRLSTRQVGMLLAGGLIPWLREQRSTETSSTG